MVGVRSLMYRNSDIRIFMIISTLANLLAVGAFAFGIMFHFITPLLLYRTLSVFFLALSVTFQIQLYMLKVEIIEKKMLKMMPPSAEIHAIISSTGNMVLTLYNTLFWFALVVVAAGFVPKHP